MSELPSTGKSRVFRPHSTRKRAWYVEPIDSSRDSLNVLRSNQTNSTNKVFVGHLFNAGVEREQLGLTVGEGEECCIALEPIADARLPFSDTVRVQQRTPDLTGVELICKHRFSALYLLFHWMQAPMICPVCRYKYKLASAAPRSEPLPCSYSNFPRAYWTTLQRIIRESKREADEQERLVVAAYHRDSVLDDTLETVLGQAQVFFLMLSLENGAAGHVVQYLPIHRINENYDAIAVDVFKFSVQRQSLRRFTTAMSNASHAAAASGTGDIEQYRLMRANIVMRVGSVEDELSYLYRVAQFAPIELPVFRVQHRAAQIQYESSNVNSGVVAPMSNVPVPPVNVPVDDPYPGSIVRDVAVGDVAVGDVAVGDVAVGDATVGDIGAGVPQHVPPICPVLDERFFNTTRPVYKFTFVNSPCICMAGRLDMEMCEDSVTGGVDSLLSVSVSLQASSLLTEVARSYSE
jgi:hypothetical protein